MEWVLVAVTYLSLSGKGRGGRLLTFSASRMGAYSRWALIRGWALIRINTVIRKSWDARQNSWGPKWNSSVGIPLA